MLEPINIWERTRVTPPAAVIAESGSDIYSRPISSIEGVDLNELYTESRYDLIGATKELGRDSAALTFERWTRFYSLANFHDPFYQKLCLGFVVRGVLANTSPSIYGTLIYFSQKHMTPHRVGKPSEFETWTSGLQNEMVEVISSLSDAGRYRTFVKRQMLHELGHPLLDAFNVEQTPATHQAIDNLADHLSLGVPMLDIGSMLE